MLSAIESGPLLFAHRGAPAVFPENSLPGFRWALDVGADVLEIDVHMTRDGHPVVSHDPDGARCAGVSRAIARCDLAEVQSWDLRVGCGGGSALPVRIPTLAEVLTALPDAALIVDVKQAHPDMVGGLVLLLEQMVAGDRVLLTSFDARVLRRIRRAGYPGPTGMSRIEAAHALLSPRPLLRAFPLRGSRLQVPVAHAGLALDTRAMIERAHELGLQIDFWVINDVAHAERLLDRGADGIVTDHPDRMVPLFARHPRCRAYRSRHGPHDTA